MWSVFSALSMLCSCSDHGPKLVMEEKVCIDSMSRKGTQLCHQLSLKV